MVFYRKYRPQTINELDKEEIRERLVNIFQSGRVPHAFLFAGPKGTGKTSAARIVAKVVNCLRNNLEKVVPLIEPCNACSNCQAITKGIHLDILEIDAASYTGVDNIRELQEKINLSPAQARKKVYIIDEVHMLSKGAFNALLKTLEEPPSHVIFILATTEVHKLPETIISRCAWLNFSKATEEEIVRSLKRVVAGEKLKVEDRVLELIASHSDGSFRDAVKILEQAVIESARLIGGQEEREKDMTTRLPARQVLRYYDIKKLLGREGLSSEKLLEYLAEKKTKEALEFVQKKVEEGVDLRFLTEAVLEDLHEALLAKHGIEDHPLEGSSSGRIILEAGDLKKLIQLFSRAHQEMKTSFIEQLPLELAIIEWCENK